MNEPVTPLRGSEAPARASAHSRVLPVARESGAPAPAAVRVHPVVQVIDHLVEFGVSLMACYLCAQGKCTFIEFAIFAGAVLGVQNTIRQVGGRNARDGGGGTGASGVVGLAVMALGGAYLRSRGIALLGALGALALALALGACGGTGPALRTQPVFGYYVSSEWGKCAVGGVRVSSVGSVMVTAHGCVRAEGADASVGPITGFTPLGGTRDPLQPVAAYPDAGAGDAP